MEFQYDEEIIRLFVEKDKKEGFLFKLSRPNRRDEVVSALSNAIQFDPSCMTELPKKPKVNELYLRLKDMGDGERAYIFSRVERTARADMAFA